MGGNHGKKPSWNDCMLYAFGTLWIQIWKILAKTAFLWLIFTLVNACKTYAKNRFKYNALCMCFATLYGDIKNHFQMNAFFRRFETLCGNRFEKKNVKNGVFISNSQFGKSVQNKCKKRFELNAFSFRFVESN